MLMRNVSKEPLQPFSIGNEEKVLGTFTAMEAGVPVRRERRAMVEVFTPTVKPGDVVDIPSGLACSMGGTKDRGSYLASIGMADKLKAA